MHVPSESIGQRAQLSTIISNNLPKLLKILYYIYVHVTNQSYILLKVYCLNLWEIFEEKTFMVEDFESFILCYSQQVLNFEVPYLC